MDTVTAAFKVNNEDVAESKQERSGNDFRKVIAMESAKRMRSACSVRSAKQKRLLVLAVLICFSGFGWQCFDQVVKFFKVRPSQEGGGAQ